MAQPPEVQKLIDLTTRQAQLQARREQLNADTSALNAEFGELFDSGALGVTEARPLRLVHVRTQGGRIRILKIRWVAVINGRNVADAEVIDVDENTGG